MSASLSLVALSDAFSEFWSQLAGAAGLELIPLQAGVADESVPIGGEGVLISAGGVEERAVEVVKRLRGRCDGPLVVVGTETDHRLVLSLVQAGAADYFALPGELALLRRWVAGRAGQGARPGRVAEPDRRYDFSGIVGRSVGLLAALERAALVIPHAATTVLVTGETGTGKDLLARCIHLNGPRAAKPYVEINCAALPATLLEAELFGYERGAFTDARTAKPGLFEAAHEGTLFLDEIGDLPPELQAKLLRVLEAHRVRRLGSVREQEVDVRIITATHVDLARAVEQHRFRRDLFYRLDVATIELPPLRARQDDVVLLAEHFARQFAARQGAPPPLLGPEIRVALRRHGWPGNVRELKNAVERALLFGGGSIRAEHLVGNAPALAAEGLAVPFPASMRAIEGAAARAAVEHFDGNKSDAARVLGISRKYLYALLGDSRSGEHPHYRGAGLGLT